MVYPGLTNELLLSIGQLCDDGCVALFTKSFLYLFKNYKLLLKGHRNPKDGLWDVPFTSPTYPSSHNSLNLQLLQTSPILTYHSASPINNELLCNYIIALDKPKHNLAQYLYGCMFAPSISTLEEAICCGHLISWPGIEDINFKKYVGTNVANAKGHLDQFKQNL